MKVEYKSERIVETCNGQTTKDVIRIERKKTTDWGGICSNITSSCNTLTIPTYELPILIGKLKALLDTKQNNNEQ